MVGMYSAVPPPPDDSVSAPPPQQSQSPRPEAPHHQPASPYTPNRSGHQTTASGAIDIEAWTVSALQSLSISPIARGTGTPLSIPLDEASKQQKREQKEGLEGKEQQATRTVTIAVDGTTEKDPIRRPPSRRDSLKRREALLKGKEGSRQRRRWENDRLINVPNAQPPLPSDFAPQATHPVFRVPYHLAAFWDRDHAGGPSLRKRQDEKYLAQQARKKTQQIANGSATGLGAGMVPRDLREYAKRSPAVKNWVRYLEEPVRRFALQVQMQREGDEDERTDEEGLDSEDEEIVFVGRKNQGVGREAAPLWKKATLEVGGTGRTESGVVFDELGDDESAAFKRWITHSISNYYGLESRSVTTGTPARRVVYVGSGEITSGQRGPRLRNEMMPRPLWEVC